MCYQLSIVGVVFPGVVNISYETVRGSLQDLSQVEGGGALAEPGQDFLSVSGSVILQDGQISVAIPVTILDVRPPPGLCSMPFQFSQFIKSTEIPIPIFLNAALCIFGEL
jgi:hypothetical protein